MHQRAQDRDGTITPVELHHAVDVLKLRLNDIQMVELLNRMDLDGDGVIEYAELCEGRRMLSEKARQARLTKTPA